MLTTADYNKFTSDALDVKIKQKELVSNYDISNLLKNSNLDQKIEMLATKAELKAVQNKIVKLVKNLIMMDLKIYLLIS